jgi:hypothetical protein
MEIMNENYSIEEHPSGWQRFRDQIPVILATVILVSLAAGWIYSRTASREEAVIAPLREQNEALRAQADENQRQLLATTELLRGAISRHEGDLFKSDEEIQKLNGDRINNLADAIAQKVAPALPRQTPEELAKLQEEEVEQISTRTADKLRPSLGELSQKQQAINGQVVAGYNQRIQALNAKVEETQAAAQDALQLSHEVSALYLNSFNDQGVLVRLMSLPAEVVRDTAQGSLITSRQRKKTETQLDQKMREIEDRLRQIQAQGTSAPVANN